MSDQPPDDGYHEYLPTDLEALVQILRDSTHAPVVKAALVLDHLQATLDTFETSQKLLKQALQDELLEKNLGALNPEKTRLMSLVFVVEDARLVLDDKGLPVFRPGSGETPPLGVAVAQELVTIAQQEAEEEKTRVGLSQYLFDDIFGVEADGQVASLKKFAKLSSTVYTALQDAKRTALEIYAAATDGLTTEDLQAQKTKLEGQIADLVSQITSEEGEKTKAETQMASLDITFKELLSGMDFAEDLPDISALVGDDPSSHGVEALFETIIQQFESKAAQEKAASSAAGIKEELETQRLRTEGILQNSRDDKAKLNSRISDLQTEVNTLNSDIDRALNDKLRAQQRAQDAENDSASAQNKMNGLDSALSALDSVTSRERYWSSSDLSTIERYVYVGSLRSACSTLSQKLQDQSSASSEVSRLERSLRSAQSTESSALSAYNSAKSTTRSRKQTYDSTSAKIKSGKSEKTNPDKEKNRKRWEDAKNTEASKQRSYNNAVSNRGSVERQLSSARSTKSSRDREVSSARTTRQREVSDVRQQLDSLKSTANQQRMEANINKSEAETDVASYQLTIASKTEAKISREDSLSVAQQSLQQVEDLLSLVGSRLADIVSKIDQQESGRGTASTDAEPQTPEQESAARRQLQDLMNQRNTLSTSVSQYTQNLVALRSQKGQAEKDLRDTKSKLSSDPTEREQERLAAEETMNDAIRAAVAKASLQLTALIATAGYENFGTWSGTSGEDRSKGILRLLVADIKGLTTQSEFRKSRAEEAYEQLPGSEISDVDMQSVERIVEKLYVALTQSVSSLENANAQDLLDAVEPLVRTEFATDLDILPSTSVLVNSCQINENTRWQDSVVNPSTNNALRLIYSFNELYNNENDTPESNWMLFRLIREVTQTPLEDSVEELTVHATSDWALAACASYLIESWLRNKDVKLATVEDLGDLITKFESLRLNPEDAPETLEIFRQPEPVLNEDVSFKISKWTMERILNIRESALKSEREVVDSSESDIVSLVKRTKICFAKLTKDLFNHAISLISSEILRRKMAILSGDVEQLGGVASDEASALEADIATHQTAIDDAQLQQTKLQEKYEAAVADAEATQQVWETYKERLEGQIRAKEAELVAKRDELTQAINSQSENEANILQTLKDTAKLREQLSALTSQRDHVESQVDSARAASDGAAQDLNRAKGEISALEIRKQELESLKSDAEAKRDALTEWINFIQALSSQLTEDKAGVVKRLDFATRYKALDRSENVKALFDLIGQVYPKLKSAADKFSGTVDALRSLDLREALDQHLVKYPSVDYQPKSSSMEGVFTLHGNSLSYSEVENALLAFITERCRRAGLLFGDDGKMFARDESSIPNFKSAGIPEVIRELVYDRIKLYYQPDYSTNLPSWDEYLEKEFIAASEMLNEMKEYCGITKWDVARAYANTIEVVVGSMLVIDKEVNLPGLNFFVTAGTDIHVESSCRIITSASPTIQYKNPKARSGSSYKSDPSPNGRRGDDGLNAPPGRNAGHVTLNAYRTLSWDDEHLNIEAVGAEGVKGQNGGDGEQGRKGIQGKPAVPKDTDGWKNRQVSWGWTRYPGCENDGTPSTKPTRVQELSGSGGDGGVPGAGGEGGNGGEVILEDKQTTKVHEIPQPSSASDSLAAVVQFGNLSAIVTSRAGGNGENGSGVGKGGKGGEPGKKGVEKVHNKQHFFQKTKTKTGYIRKNYTEGLVQHALGISEERKDDETWGWRRYVSGYSYTSDDWDKGKYPFLSASEAQEILTSELSRGSSGTPGGGAGGGGGAQHAKQRKRQKNKNISAEEEYQSQKYQTIQTMQHEESFAKIGTEYTAQKEELQQQVNALSQQLSVVSDQERQAQQTLNRVRERSVELATKSSEMQEQLKSIDSIISKTSDQIVHSDKVALSQIIASMEQSETISQLSQELQNIMIDNKYSSKAISQLQNVAVGIQALQLAKQMEIKEEQEKLSQQITELTSQLLKSEQSKGELANVNTVSTLEELLRRTQQLQQDQITQQQQKQKSVQVEADPEDDTITHLIGSSILLSIRDTFARGEDTDNIWPSLTTNRSTRAVESVLSAIPELPEDKRALTVELLEILVRYCIFSKQLNILEDMFPLWKPFEAHNLVLEKLQSVDEDLRNDHWFIGSLTGATLMITSSENISVDQSSLTSRYEQVEGVPVFDELTKLEREAAKLVNELASVGTNLQHIAQFLAEYKDTMVEAQTFVRQGYLSILQGKPVKLIDKLSRITLMFFRRNDDALAVQNIELALGIAKTVKSVKDSVGVMVLENALNRKRDIRGGGGYTRLLLDNAEKARTRVETGDNDGALSAMRNTDAPAETPTEYGPRDFDSLLNLVGSVVLAPTPADVASTMSAVARALAAGVAARTVRDIMKVLERIRSITFSGTDAADKQLAVSGPMSACATIGGHTLAVLLSRGDENAEGILRKAMTSRSSVPFLEPQQRVSRVYSLFQFVKSDEWTCLNASEDACWTVLLESLNTLEMPYPERSDGNVDFIEHSFSRFGRSIFYESSVESIAFMLFVVRPEYAQVGFRHVDVDMYLDRTLKWNSGESSLVNFLRPMALRTRSLQVERQVRANLSTNSPARTEDIRDRVNQRFGDLEMTEAVTDHISNIVASIVLGLPVATLKLLWQDAVSNAKTQDVFLLAVALSQVRGTSLQQLQDQMQGILYLWEEWPTNLPGLEKALLVLHEVTTAVLRSITGNILVSFNVFTTEASEYCREVVEGALNTLIGGLVDFPKKLHMSLHAAKLNIVSSLSQLIQENVETKKGLGRTTEYEKREEKYLEADRQVLLRIAKLLISFVGVSNEHSDIKAATITVMSTQTTGESEADLRRLLVDTLKRGAELEKMQLTIAHRLYLTMLTRCTEKRSVFLGTDECLLVAQALMAVWKERNDFDCRTAALALLQAMVVEIRNRGRHSVMKDIDDVSKMLDDLINTAKKTLETRTASTGDENDFSQALLSENERRTNLWKVYMSQFCDEAIQKRTDTWTPLATDLGVPSNADAFENTLARHVNSLIHSRVASNQSSLHPIVLPATLAPFTKSAWATANWDTLDRGIQVSRFDGGTGFDVNVKLQEIIDVLALILPMIEAKTEDEDVTKTTERGDAIAYVMDKISDAYEGMHMILGDDDLEMRLATTVADISRHGQYKEASTKLRAASERLAKVLEQMNAGKGRYSQVEEIGKDTFERSYQKHELDAVDENCVLASELITRVAKIGDMLENRSQTRLFSFVSDIHSRSFKSHVTKLRDLLDSEFVASKVPTNVDEAKRRLLSIRKGDESTILNFHELAEVCNLLISVEDEVQGIVAEAYAARFDLLAGRLHFALGMAQESDFNPVRGSVQQKNATAEEYTEATKNGCDAASNNRLYNRFYEARSGNMTYDVSRALVKEEFEKLADRDSKAAKNLLLLNENKRPTHHYVIADDIGLDSENDGVFFSNFNRSIRELVPMLEKVINAASAGSKPLMTLSHVFGDRMDTLFNALDGNDLHLGAITTKINDCASETMQRVRTAPPFEELGGFQSTLSHLYQATNLTEVRGTATLLSVIDDAGDVLDTLFPRKGDTVLNKAEVTKDVTILRLLLGVLPQIVDVRLARLKETHVDEKSEVRMRREAMAKRLLIVATRSLVSILESSDDAKLQKARSMIDAILFRDDDLLAFTGLQPDDLFDEAEQQMAEMVGTDNKIAAIYEEDLVGRQTVLKPPFLWTDELLNQSILNLLRRSTYAALQSSIDKVRESFWSPSLRRETQEPLKLAEDEVTKIGEAMSSIFTARTVDSVDENEQFYQDVFNAGHYIMYLITQDYIYDVRRLKAPKGEKLDEQAQRMNGDIYEEANGMVVTIKEAAGQLLDLFAISKNVHELLAVVESVFKTKSHKVFKLLGDLLDLPEATPMGFFRALSLIHSVGSSADGELLQHTLKRTEEQISLDGIVLAAAFNLIESGVAELCDMLKRNEQEQAQAVTAVRALRQQDLGTESGAKFVTLIFGIVNNMVSEARQDKSTNAASKEEFDALLNTLGMVIDSQAWRSSWLMDRLKLYSTPMSWVPILDAFGIAVSLSYDPDATTEQDTYWFQKAAQAIQRLRSRRGESIAQDLILCLQAIVHHHPSAETLAKIANLVASNRWPFSASDVPVYKEAAKTTSTTAELISHLETIATQKRAAGGERSILRLIELLKEDAGGVNRSIAHLLEMDEDGQVTKLEKRAQDINKLVDTHTNEDGKVLKDWKKKDTVAWATEFKNHSADYFTEEHTEELNLMLAVFSVVTGKVKKYDRPRKPQLLSIILLVDSMVRGKGQLAELGTGEGKSLLVMMLATARVFKGETVDIITSSRVLAERDANDAQEWFDHFDMHVTNNCDNEAEADPAERKKRYHEHAIIYGTTGAFERDILLTKYYDKDIRAKTGDSLIVDEVDTLFIDNMGNTLYISHSIQDLKHLNQVFVSIWRAVHAKDASYYSESSVATVTRLIRNEIENATLIIPNWLEEYMQSRLDIWIRNAYNAKSMEEGDQYKLYETGQKRGQVVVVDLYTGVEMPSTQWSNGLHQFVQLKHNNKLSPESLKAIFVANVSFVKQYSGVMGCTGTLGGSAELELLNRVYEVDAFRMPRFTEVRYFEEPAVIVGNRERWLELLADEVITKSKYSEGFDVEKAKLDAAENEEKLNKDRKKIAKLEKKIASREAEIDETEQIETDLLRSVAKLRTPAQIDITAVETLKSLVSDLEGSEAIDEGDEEYGKDRVHALSLAVGDMESHLTSVANADEEARQLSEEVNNLQLELHQESLQSNASRLQEITANLNSKKADKASKEEQLQTLRDEIEAKGNQVITLLSEARQGFSFIATTHVEELREKIYEDQIDLQDEREDVIKHSRRLESSSEALASGSGGRAVLVICRNKNDCDDVRDALISRGDSSIVLYTYTGTTEGITKVDPVNGKTIEVHAELSELKPHDVIIATNIAGRGTSLKTTEVLEQCGGLHVVLSYVPSNVRVEVQAWGRTSRHGSNGSGRFVAYDPRVVSSDIPVDIDYLLSERDVDERERLEKLETETVPRVELESVLFEEFSRISASLKSSFDKKSGTGKKKNIVSSEWQLKELRDQWAFFLESHDETLQKCYLHPEKSKRELLAALQTFKAEQNEAAKGKVGLIASPGNLLLVVNDALRREDYEQAKTASQMIIEKDRQFAAFGYYYHALSMFGSGTDNASTKRKAVKELEKAIFLLKRMSDQLLGQSQIISSINSLTEGKGLGTDTLEFEKSNSNMQSLLQIHISAAEKITGRALKQDDFDTSAINGDATKEVFDIINDEKKLREFFSPLRVSENLEVRLRISVTKERKSAVQFLRDSRLGDVDGYVWEGDILEVADVTDTELRQVKKLGMDWELALYRHGNEFEKEDRLRITFPQAFSYAVPKMLENLREMAKDGDGNPISFEDVSEDKLAKVKDLLFSPLLLEAEITGHLNKIVTGDSAEDYLVMEKDYIKKTYGRWDGVGFREIGSDMKKWILFEAGKGKPILKSSIQGKAQKLLTGIGEKDADKKASGVVDAVVAQGVGKLEKLRELKPDVVKIISEESTVIFIKSDVSDDKIESLSLEGFKILEKHKSKIVEELKKFKGKKLMSEQLVEMIPEDDREEAISSNVFFTLQTLTRAGGVSKYLCERLDILVEEHKKDTLDDILRPLQTTVDITAAAKVDSSSQLQKALITQELLRLPRVYIGIDSYTGGTGGTSSKVVSKKRKLVQAKSSDHSDAFSTELKNSLKAQIKKIAAKVKAKDKDLEEKTKEMMNDVIEAFKGSVTELATTLTGTLKVDFQTLTQRITDEESVPPELIDFVAMAAEITFKLVKKKTFADYWDWNAFAVALIGLVQVVAGAVILVVTAGAATNIAGALIGEGIGDMIYATTAGLTGTFSWKEYGIQKAISLGVTMTVGLVSAGIGTVMSRAAQTSAIATKVAVSAVVKAVAKKVTGEIVKAAVSYGVGMGAQKLSELATGAIFNTFKSNFQSMAESNAMCQKSVAKIKSTLDAMMDKYGKEKATKYITDAITDAAAAASAGTWETNISTAVMKAAGEVSNSLGAIGKRMEQSGHKWAKIVGAASQWIGYASRMGGVIDAIQQIVRYLPAIYDKTNKRLMRIQTKVETTPKDVLTGKEKTEWIQKYMKKISDQIYKAVEALTYNGITGAAVNEILSFGMEKLYARTVDKLSRDYEELETRAVAGGIIKGLGSKDSLTRRERDALVDLQQQLTDPKNKYPSVLSTINPVKDPSVKVMFNGKVTRVADLTGILGTKGIKVLPIKTGEAYGVVVRPRYEDYVSGVTVHKHANLFDLHAMAKAANVNVALTYTENGEKKSVNIDPVKGDGVETVKIQLLKNDEYPQGRYVLLDDDGNVKMQHDFEAIGNASGAQVLLYAGAVTKSKDSTAALSKANSEDEVKQFLKKVRREALNDEDMKDTYVEGEHELKDSILGGSSPPPLPLVPVQRQPSESTTILSRAIPQLPSSRDMELERRTMDQGDEGADIQVVTIRTSNKTLRSFVGMDLDSAGEGEITRPRITLAAISRVKEALSSLPLGDMEPLRFVVETERPEDRAALELRRGELRYGFSIDGYTETGTITASDRPKAIQDGDAEAVDVEDLDTELTFVEGLSSAQDLDSSSGELEYGFEIEANSDYGLRRWATSRNLDLDTQPVLNLDDITIEDLEV